MIQNNIHQIWVGDKRIPTHIKYHMDEVKQRHPEFNYFFWHDGNLPELPEQLKKVHDAYQDPAIKADLLRMYVVYTHGGIYMDADFKVIDGFRTDIISYKDHAGFVVYNDSYGMSALANTMFGFEKNNPLLGYLLENVTHIGQWIGPNWWAQTVCKYLEMNNDQINVDQFKEKISSLNVQVVHWKSIEDHCFRHEALATWMPGSIWNEKLKTGNYD